MGYLGHSDPSSGKTENTRRVDLESDRAGASRQLSGVEDIVLIISDDRRLQENAVSCLEGVGFSCEVFSHSLKFVTFLSEQERAPKVVLIDCDGLAINPAKLVRSVLNISAPHSTDVVLVTSERDYELALTCLRLGIKHILHKPVSSSEIVAVVDRPNRTEENRNALGGTNTIASVSELLTKEVAPRAMKTEDFLVLLDMIARLGTQANVDYQETQMLADIAVSQEARRKTTVTGLAYGLRLPQATIHRKVKHLETLGLIDRSFDQNDKRLCYLGLTESGFSVLDEIVSQIEKRYRAVESLDE